MSQKIANSSLFYLAFSLTFIFLGCQNLNRPILDQDGIKIIEMFIPMSDGTRLAADIYLPSDITPDKRLPVLLEYLPYRKDEGRGRRFSAYSYFVYHDYIVARVDIRGTGRSEGKLVDGEYSEQEQLDGVEVIDWLSKQSFSTGNIGMFGISWGGFNSLQIAMRKPPALKTIISLMSTDDIYQDDVHFMDGIMHIDAYELGIDLANAVPAAPDYKIDDSYFKNRFDTEPWLLKYKQQQNDGPFWDRASLNSDYSAINIPVFVIGGWYDGYRDFIPRMIEHADVPVKALIGPWNHTWPNTAYPLPAIEWRSIASRWYDHWLKGAANGILHEPRVSYFQRSYHTPGENLTNIPGTWHHGVEWPTTIDSQFYISPNHQLTHNTQQLKEELTYRPSTGIEASGSVMWWGDWAPDQGLEDPNSLIYDSAPITDSLAIVGFPKVKLNCSVSSPSANWVVRLCDVAPDGQVTLITGAGYNANHILSPEQPISLVPDSIYQIEIELHTTSWTFLLGHRIRLAINNAQWPMFWPSPFPMSSTVYSSPAAPSTLTLPILKNSSDLDFSFENPVDDPLLEDYYSLDAETLSGFAEVSGSQYDSVSHITTVNATNSGTDIFPWGKSHYTESITHKVHDLDPSKANVNSLYTQTMDLKNRELRWEGIFSFSSDSLSYYYNYTRRLLENEKLIREKNWNKSIPRAY